MLGAAASSGLLIQIGWVTDRTLARVECGLKKLAANTSFQESQRGVLTNRVVPKTIMYNASVDSGEVLDFTLRRAESHGHAHL
jgi:hypothetical protein